MKRKISLFLIMALLTATLGAFTSDSVPAGEKINEQGKITQALEKRIADAKSEDEVIPVYIWITGIDSDEVLTETERRFGMSEEDAIQDVDLFSGIDLESMKDDEAADIMEEIGKKLEADPELKEKHAEYAQRANEFIGLKRQISKERYTERNAAFLSRAGLAEKDLVFVSRFSPMIIAEISVEKVKALAESDEVVYLNEFVNAEGKPCQSISLQVTGGYFNKTVYGYTGTYVNVGQIDNGVPANSTTATIIYRNKTNFYDYTSHATRIAEIIGGDYGYAPNCRIFSYKSMNEENFYDDVEELIARSGNDTIHIINVSMNYDSLYTEGTYSDVCSWVDHITEEYEVIFTVASGNGDQSIDKVVSPGMAYNAITVGNLDDKESLTQTDHRICTLIENGDYKQSLYLENDNLAEKPDIVAPGSGIDIVNMNLDSLNTGTSFAAPQAAGALAQLMYASNNLKYRPSLSKALINVGARYKLPDGDPLPEEDEDDFTYDAYSGTAVHTYSDRDGAGELSAKNAAWVLASGRYTYYLGGTSTFPKTVTFNVSASDSIIRVALAWEKREAVGLSNLNLSVTAPNGTAYSLSLTNNVEVVEILPSLYGTGTYTITITRPSGSGTEWVSVAWY